MSNLKHIFQSVTTPIYIYEKDVIKRQIDIIKDSLPQFDYLFSIKSNPFQPVLDFISSQGVGSDAASLKEVEFSLKAGMKPADIYFSTPGKTKSDIEGAIGKSVIIADSYNELSMINEVAKANGEICKVGLRINPFFTMDGEGGVSTKFGVDEETIAENKGFINSLTNIQLVGIHIHVKSQELVCDKLYNYYKNVFELALRVESFLDCKLEFINFGGGLGISYSANQQPLDIAYIKNNLPKLVDEYKQKLPNVRLLIESGRFMVCQSGTYVTEIVDIKVSRGKKYLVIKNSLNGFFKPSIRELVCGCVPDGNINFGEPLYTSKDAFEITIDTTEAQTEIVNVVGHLCTAADIVAHDISLPIAKIGDKMLFSNAGSYAYCLSPMLFASQPPPEQIMY